MTLHSIDNTIRHTRLFLLASLVTLGLAIAGCQSMSDLPPSTAAALAMGTNSLQLHPGDTVKVSFPGAPNLDSQTPIRLDGKISLPMIGEVSAAGLTPSELEKEILRIAGPQLVVKQVTVTVLTSAFEIYVEGAVLRPGKLISDRVLTPLEAVSDAGIDFQKANLKSVRIIRKDAGGQTRNYKINVQRALDGKSSDMVELKSYDIVYVPERFSWF